MNILRGDTRGATELGWLSSAHSFSFADYYDPERMGFSVLRVLNDDRVAPGGGFPNHSHRDMEIVSYVLEGRLRHRDSMGNGAVLGRGAVQYMSAGTGITHSEQNASDTGGLHFLQIWILPDAAGHTPRYGEMQFSEEERTGRWCLLASPDGAEGSAPMYQDATIRVAVLKDGKGLDYAPEPGRSVYLHVATGAATVNGEALAAGDAAVLPDAGPVAVTAAPDAEVLLFDLP